MARPAAFGQFVFAAIAFACLAWCFLDNDFSVLYVASNSHADLPGAYRFAAVWGGHEGSMLLWLCLLSAWTVAVALFSRQLPEAYVARVLAVMAWLSVGFLLFLLFLSNPFTRLMPPALEGRDLNPLLQDPGMVVHPPILYMGYVGFSVAFAFAIAALLSGELDAAWARWSRPWTVAAWMFLTLGILLGSAWAYYVLGWGGWWFWDPVENASFMPWLVGTALIHSLAVTEQRGAFRSWTVLLAICTFSLSLLGTFLVRSGVLTSVHAFAVDPGRGLFILAFMVAVVGGSLLLFGWRAPRIGLGGRFGLLSRESLLLANNVMLTVAAMSVLIGTLYPLALDVLARPEDFRRAAVLRGRVRADHGAGDLPDGRRADGALEARAAARTGAAPSLGAGRQRRGRAAVALDAAGRAARLVAAVHLRAAAGGVGRCERRGACLAAPSRRTGRLARRAYGASRAAGGACWPRMPASASSSSARRWPTASKASRSSCCTWASTSRWPATSSASKASRRRAARTTTRSAPRYGSRTRAGWWRRCIRRSASTARSRCR